MRPVADRFDDVRNIARTTAVFGAGSIEQAVRSIGLRALDVEDEEICRVAMPLL
jgi:hypothetical protein